MAAPYNLGSRMRITHHVILHLFMIKGGEWLVKVVGGGAQTFDCVL